MDTNARQTPIAARPAAPQIKPAMSPRPPMPPLKPAVENRPSQKPEQLAESPLLHNWRAAGTPVVVTLRSGREVKGKLLRITRWNFDIQDASGSLLVVHKHAVDVIAKQ